MDAFWLNEGFYVSVGVFSVVAIGLSAIAQYADTKKEGEKIRTKALARDGIFGAIFAVIGWIIVPGLMKNLVNFRGSFATPSAVAQSGGAVEIPAPVPAPATTTTVSLTPPSKGFFSNFSFNPFSKNGSATTPSTAPPTDLAVQVGPVGF